MEHFAEKDVFTYIATRKSKTASEAKTTNNLNPTERDLGTSLADQPGLDREPKNLKSLGSIANQHGGWSILDRNRSELLLDKRTMAFSRFRDNPSTVCVSFFGNRHEILTSSVVIDAKREDRGKFDCNSAARDVRIFYPL